MRDSPRLYKPTDIDAPSELKATEVLADSSVLTWVPPLADIDGYVLAYGHEDGKMKVLSTETHFGTSNYEYQTLKYIWP